MDVTRWKPSPELERAVRAEIQARFDTLPERLFDNYGRVTTSADPEPSASDQHLRLKMFSVFAGMVREAASAVVSVSSRVHGVNPQPEMVEWLRRELTGLIPAVVTGCIYGLHRMGLLRQLSIFDGMAMRWSLKREAQRECELALKPLWLATMQSDTGAAPVNVFLSHATEDLETVARPLARALENAGCAVWLSRIRTGTDIVSGMDDGIRQAQKALVILSPAFFEKSWTMAELRALLARQRLEGPGLIVPVWHGVTAAQVVEHAPELAGILGLHTGGGWETIVTEVVGSSRGELEADPPRQGMDARVSGLDGARPAVEPVTPLSNQVRQMLKEEIDAASQASYDRITTAATSGMVQNGSWLPDALDDLAIAEHRTTSRDVCERVCRVLIRYYGRIPSEIRTEVQQTIGWRFIPRYAVVFKHAVYSNGRDHRSLWTKLRLNKRTREVVVGELRAFATYLANADTDPASLNLPEAPLDIVVICDGDDSVSAAQPLAAAVRAAAPWTIDVLPVSSAAHAHGALMACRAVILVVSRSFLTRSWPSPDITLIHLREHLEHREIMIVVYRGVTQADVVSFSPLLAGRVPILEKEGTQEVVNRLSSLLTLEEQLS